MRLALDIDSRRIVDPDDLTTFVTAIKVRRGEIIPVDVRVVRNGDPVQDESSEIEIYITKAADFTALLASETGIGPVGSGDETLYSGVLDLDETAIDALFATGTVTSAEALLEIRFIEGTNDYRSEPVAMTVQNSYTAA